MKNEFVPYEEALALRELGYKGDIIGMYDEDKYLFTLHDQDDIEDEWLPAPLYQQAFRWFREEHDLWIEISKPLSWLLTISDKTQNKKMCLEDYNEYVEPKSYKEAQDACLRKLIEIVKEKID